MATTATAKGRRTLARPSRIRNPLCIRTSVYTAVGVHDLLRLQCLVRVHGRRPRRTLVRRSHPPSDAETKLTAYSPFLAFVSDRETFDERLSQYVATDYVQLK